MSYVLEAISGHARASQQQIAVSDGKRALTYGALECRIAEIANALEIACPGGRPIALVAGNTPEWVLIDLAAVRLKRTLVPLPKFFTPEQTRHALAQTGVEFLISDTPVNNGVPLQALGGEFQVERLDLPEIPLPPCTQKVTYTSGSTGQPKGVCLSQDGMETVSLALVDSIGAHYAGVHFAALPLGVLLENVAGLYTTLLAGGHYHVLPQSDIGFSKAFVPDIAALVNALAATQANTLILVPELLRGIVATMAEGNIRLPDLHLVAVGGARIAPAVLEAATKVGIPVYEGYGLSEAASVVALNTPSYRRAGSVGRVLPHVQLSVSADGEAILHNPAFLGYAGEGAANLPYSTGDIVRLDREGYLYIEGRKSNTLITGFGRNVSPEWVESELTAQPQIAQALVFGDAAPALGALIVPRSITIQNSEIAAAIACANAALPAYAQVRHWTKVFPFAPANAQLTGNGRMRRATIHAAHGEVMQRCLTDEGQYISFFERLAHETIAEREYLMATPQIRDGLEGRITRETYLLYLQQAYHHVKHTVPLLELVRSKLPKGREWLYDALSEYIHEETGHEEWILDDIQNAGGDRDAARASQPAAETEMMVAYAYDYVNRINPVGFFGMVFVLEGTSTQLATRGAQALMRSLQMPPSCFRYLTSHGALDIGHMEFFRSLMDRIDIEEDRAAIVHMARRMFVLFGNVFRAIPHNAAKVQHAA